MSDVLTAFVEAFNARDLDAMAALLAADATARVLAAPFPVEEGAEVIRHTSFPHISDPALDLEASRLAIEGADWILLRARRGAGPIDTALSLGVAGGKITRIEYVVGPHQPDRLRSLGAACGLPTVVDPPALREVTEDDLETFFEQQLDPKARHMAAFTARDSSDRDAFLTRWKKILADGTVTKRTVLLGGVVAGHVAAFDQADQREVTYWIAREHWGQGVATRALKAFLEEERTRPLFARVACDNAGSIRVLEKCGFEVTHRERGFAHARGEEIEEAVLKLALDPEAHGGRPDA